MWAAHEDDALLRREGTQPLPGVVQPVSVPAAALRGRSRWAGKAKLRSVSAALGSPARRSVPGRPELACLH